MKYTLDINHIGLTFTAEMSLHVLTEITDKKERENIL